MREKHRLFIVDGWKTIIELLDKFELHALCATENWITEKYSFIERYINLVYTCDRKELSKISQMQSAPDVIAVFRLPDLNCHIDFSPGKLYLMLDTIQDPGNMGTIIRSADWFGVENIIASETCVDIFNPKCIQASMGSISRVKVYYKNLYEILSDNRDIPVFGTLLNGENIYKKKLGSNGFIIFGNEGKGISKELQKFISHPLLIPPYNKDSHAESLNVAAAVAVTLSIFRNQ